MWLIKCVQHPGQTWEGWCSLRAGCFEQGGRDFVSAERLWHSLMPFSIYGIVRDAAMDFKILCCGIAQTPYLQIVGCGFWNYSLLKYFTIRHDFLQKFNVSLNSVKLHGLKYLPLHRSTKCLPYCATTAFSYTSNLYWIPFSSWISAGTPGYLGRENKKKQKPISRQEYHCDSPVIYPINEKWKLFGKKKWKHCPYVFRNLSNYYPWLICTSFRSRNHTLTPVFLA